MTWDLEINKESPPNLLGSSIPSWWKWCWHFKILECPTHWPYNKHRKEWPLPEFENKPNSALESKTFSFICLSLWPFSLSHPIYQRRALIQGSHQVSRLGKRDASQWGLMKFLAILNPSFPHLVCAKSSKLWAPYWFHSLELHTTHQYPVGSVQTEPSWGEYVGMWTVWKIRKENQPPVWNLLLVCFEA